MRYECRESVSEKADRLKGNYRVILIGASEGLVIGDHDSYQVSKANQRWSCNCRWGRYRGHFSHCSHVVAVRRALKDPASQGPVSRLADLILANREGR